MDATTNVKDKAVVMFLAQSGQRVGMVTSFRFSKVDLK